MGKVLEVPDCAMSVLYVTYIIYIYNVKLDTIGYFQEISLINTVVLAAIDNP